MRAAAKIAALLQELASDQNLLDRLSQNDYGKNRTAKINISGWFKQWNKDRNLWRLKLWELEDKGIRYRIIYAFIPLKKQYQILAIAPRDFEYDEKHPITQRIVSSYDKI